LGSQRREVCPARFVRRVRARSWAPGERRGASASLITAVLVEWVSRAELLWALFVVTHRTQ
jgi:hypothetical protein